MRVRRAEARKILKPDERLISMGNFPRLGCPDFTWPQFAATPDKEDGVARSAFFPDEAIFSGHPRWVLRSCHARNTVYADSRTSRGTFVIGAARR